MWSSTSPGALATAVHHGPIQAFDGEMLSKLIATASASLDSDRATAKDCIQRAADLLQAYGKERFPVFGCVDDVAKQANSGCALPPRILRNIREYIEKHLEEKLGLSELASVVGMSVSHFCRCFRQSVGLTPHDYVIRRRVLSAQVLLAETDLELADIALRTGFTDQSHFSRRFHELTGTPPNRFRRQHR